MPKVSPLSTTELGRLPFLGQRKSAHQPVTRGSRPSATPPQRPTGPSLPAQKFSELRQEQLHRGGFGQLRQECPLCSQRGTRRWNDDDGCVFECEKRPNKQKGQGFKHRTAQNRTLVELVFFHQQRICAVNLLVWRMVSAPLTKPLLGLHQSLT